MAKDNFRRCGSRGRVSRLGPTQYDRSNADKPYAMLGVNVFAADSDAEAQRMFSSLQQQFINLRRGTPGPLPPPTGDMDALWSPAEKPMVGQSLSCSAVGSPDVIGAKLKALIAETDADELMTTGQIYDHAARLRSFEIAAEVRERLAAQPAT